MIQKRWTTLVINTSTTGRVTNRLLTRITPSFQLPCVCKEGTSLSLRILLLLWQCIPFHWLLSSLTRPVYSLRSVHNSVFSYIKLDTSLWRPSSTSKESFWSHWTFKNIEIRSLSRVSNYRHLLCTICLPDTLSSVFYTYCTRIVL